MRTAVITVVAGRHEHLRAQRVGLAGGRPRPDLHVVVAMGDPGIGGVLSADLSTRLVTLPVTPAGLPLAGARNTGAAAALRDGAELLVFLDVDCIPDPALLERYRRAAARTEHSGQLLCGPVHYLPPPGPDGYDETRLATLAPPHPARPAPAAGVVEVGEDRNLFWSLSFAVRADAWRRIGGFCADYLGYGAEDTDFALVAAQRGVGLRWVGGATAYHQYHPVSRPPVEHLADILRNGAVFRQRWGWWPMRGWLEAFAALGLVRHDAGSDDWTLVA